MKHLNSCRLVAVHTATSGKIPHFHDLVEFACVVLTPALVPDEAELPFHVVMRPRRPYNALHLPRKRREVLAAGVDPDTAALAFSEWFDGLHLPPNKTIIPVACQWHLQWPFIHGWLGDLDEQRPAAFMQFHERQVRDVSCITTFFNELAYYHNLVYPFPKDILSNYARRLGVPYNRQYRTALTDALAVSAVYKKLCGFRLVAGMQLPLNFPSDHEYHSEGGDEEE